MTLQIVPLQAVPSQTLNITLDGQATTIDVYQLSTGLFVDVYLGSTPVITGQVALNLVLMVRTPYLGFVGDLVFVDTVDDSNPAYTGLGGQYQLVYGSPADLEIVVAQAGLPAFAPWAYILEAAPGFFVSYDGVNPIAVYPIP